MLLNEVKPLFEVRGADQGHWKAIIEGPNRRRWIPEFKQSWPETEIENNVIHIASSVANFDVVYKKGKHKKTKIDVPGGSFYMEPTYAIWEIPASKSRGKLQGIKVPGVKGGSIVWNLLHAIKGIWSEDYISQEDTQQLVTEASGWALNIFRRSPIANQMSSVVPVTVPTKSPLPQQFANEIIARLGIPSQRTQSGQFVKRDANDIYTQVENSDIPEAAKEKILDGILKSYDKEGTFKLKYIPSSWRGHLQKHGIQILQPKEGAQLSSHVERPILLLIDDNIQTGMTFEQVAKQAATRMGVVPRSCYSIVMFIYNM